MIENKLADYYRIERMNPGPEIINLRNEALENISAKISNLKIIELVRIYFGLSTAKDIDWFKSGFSEKDPSFSMIDNANEASILSATLLNNAMIENSFASLAVICCSISNKRHSKAKISLLNDAKSKLQNHSIKERVKGDIDIKLIKPIGKSKISSSIESSIPTGSDWSKVQEVLKQISNEAVGVTKEFAAQILSLLQPLIQQGIFIREEMDILWWHIGSWSNILKKPFSEIPIEIAAPLAGIELADLSQTIAGPIAAPMFLERTLTLNRKKADKSIQISIKDMANKFPLQEYSELNIKKNINIFADLCPILYSLYKYYEIGDSQSWQNSYKKDTLFDSQTYFDPIELAMQVYRERLMLNILPE
ncbi:GTPase-associated system all-helical protein GASH [Leptospira weilii]|uniref:GTPase-associated system all-helical protein GASH n=1 Tax=Leptospira weilii TaxID=28184 RepID=UPI0007736BC3|nr:GTPase-associated system all-helical protein GASH [Leptospira weilii]